MSYDVIIAGAGPVGLFRACELALRGVRTLVVERLADPHTPVKVALGMRGMNLPSTEGTDITLTALHIATRYSDNARQATTYRKGTRAAGRRCGARSLPAWRPGNEPRPG